jgi:hypothetical protein
MIVSIEKVTGHVNSLHLPKGPQWLHSSEVRIHERQHSDLLSFLMAPFTSLFLRLYIKGFSMGVTTVYITETVMLLWDELVTAELR